MTRQARLINGSPISMEADPSTGGWIPVQAVVPATDGGGFDLGAGENHIGQVGGHSVLVSPTLVVSTGTAYSSGDVIGGELTLVGAVRFTSGSGVLHSLTVVDQDNQKPALEVMIFNAEPTAAYTDNAAFPTLTSSDDAATRLIHRIPVAAADYVTVGGVATADLGSLGKVIVADGSTNLYAVLATTSTPLFTGISKLKVRFGILQD